MEFDDSEFFALLFEETEANPIAASSLDMTCFTALILWEIQENIIKSEIRNSLPLKDVIE